MTHQIAHDGTGYQCYRVVNGRYRLDVGPRFAAPDAAAIYCDALDLAARSAPLSGEGAGQNGPSVPVEHRSPGAPGRPAFPAGCASPRNGRDNPSR